MASKDQTDEMFMQLPASATPTRRELVTTQPDGSVDITQVDTSPKILLGVVVCDSMKQVMAMAKHYLRAGMIPRGLEGRTPSETESRVAVAIEYGMNIGLTPLQALANVLIVNNRPCLWGDALMSLVLQHKDFAGQDVAWSGEGDKKTVTFTVYRLLNGPEGKRVKQPYPWSFSVSDAKRANLWGKSGPWSSYPERMMLYRARAFALRDAFPDALRGAGLAEEFEGHTDAQTQTDALQQRLMAE
jgi:hypothetical protein